MIKRIFSYFAIFALTLALTLVNTIAHAATIVRQTVGQIGRLTPYEQALLRLVIGLLLLALAFFSLRLPFPISAILAIIAIGGSAINAYFGLSLMTSQKHPIPVLPLPLNGLCYTDRRSGTSTATNASYVAANINRKIKNLGFKTESICATACLLPIRTDKNLVIVFGSGIACIAYGDRVSQALSNLNESNPPALEEIWNIVGRCEVDEL